MVDPTAHLCSPACLKQVRPDGPVAQHKRNPLLIPKMYKFRRVKKELLPDTATTVLSPFP